MCWRSFRLSKWWQDIDLNFDQPVVSRSGRGHESQRVSIGGTRDLVHYVRFSFNRQPKAHVFPRVRVRVRLRLTVKRGILVTALE